MIRFERAALVGAPAALVFQAFVDPGQRQELMRDYVSRVECSGTGVGAEYSMWLGDEANAACVKEVTVAFDPARHTMTVEMSDTGGVVPFGNYRARLDAQDAGPGRCILVLQSSFIPVGISEEEARAMAAANYDNLFSRLEEKFRRTGGG